MHCKKNLSKKWQFQSLLFEGILAYRRRVYTEENAKVVAASWGTELLHLLAALAILHKDDLKNRIICTRTS